MGRTMTTVVTAQDDQDSVEQAMGARSDEGANG